MSDYSIENLKQKKLNFDTQLPEGYEWDTTLSKNDERVLSLTNSVWPAYLRTKSDIEITVPYLPFQYQRYNKERYFIWGIKDRTNQQLVACINGVSLYSKTNQRNFAQQGFRWALQATLEDDEVNTFCLTSATVAEQSRSMGLAKALVSSARELASHLSFHSLLIPVRPTNKHRFPDLSMEAYLRPYQQNITAEGRDKVDSDLYDPWISLHLKLGAQLLNICKESMSVTASIKWWEKHLDCSLNGQDTLNIRQGLVPLKIYPDKFLAIYTEPNVWMKYLI